MPPSRSDAAPLSSLSRRDRAAALRGRKPRVLLDDFEKLLDDFPDHVRAARKLKVTDPKHDALIRMALRGFALTSRVYKWHAPHFTYVKRRAAPTYEGLGDAALLFYCLAAGYTLGLAQEEHLSKPEFKAAEDHLDSVIRLNLPRLKEQLSTALSPDR
jgi:hypothetical protein